MQKYYPLIRKGLKLISYYLVPAFLVIQTTLFYSYNNLLEYGEKAELLVFIALFVKPISRIIPHHFFNFIVGVRRQIGIAAFWLFLFHAGGMIYVYQLYSLEKFSDPMTNIFWGGLAALGMLTLGLTSNNIATRLLKKNWKRVHRIAYPTLFLILMHTSYTRGEPEKFYFLGGLYLFLKAIEIYKVRRARAAREATQQPTESQQ